MLKHILAGTVAVFIPAAALAADGTTSVDLTAILVAVIGGTFAIINIVVGALIQKYIKNKQMADLLENALQNGIGKLQVISEGAVQESHISIPGVPDNIAPAVQYALDHAPEAMEHFGLTPAMIADKILARIGIKNIQANLAIAGANNPATPAPLDPVPVTNNPIISPSDTSTDDGTALGSTKRSL